MNNIILPALKVGVATGMTLVHLPPWILLLPPLSQRPSDTSPGTCGVFSGATFGILRSSPIGLFALVSGGQWFTLGSTYMGELSVVHRAAHNFSNPLSRC